MENERKEVSEQEIEKLRNIIDTIGNELFTEKDCCRTMYDSSVNYNVGCIAILKPEIIKKEYRTNYNQVVRLVGGFGCDPAAIGNACFVKHCADGERCRWDRNDFIGIANERVTEFAQALEISDEKGWI